MPPKPAPRQRPVPKPRQRKNVNNNKDNEASPSSPEEPGVKLYVCELPASCSEDALINYFESRRIFGCSLNVEDVNYNPDKNDAIITFQNCQDVETVLQVHATSPCTLLKQQLCVEQYRGQADKHDANNGADNTNTSNVEDNTSDEYKSIKIGTATKDNSSEEYKSLTPAKASTIGTKTIMVRGYDLGKSKDTLMYYFENQCRKVGGEVDHVTSDEEMGCMFVEFTEEKAVVEVLEKAKTSSFVLEGCQLSVRPYVYSETDVLFTNVPDTVTEENLRNFLEARIKVETSPTPVVFSVNKDRAVVKFIEPVDFKLLTEVCKQRKLQDAFLEPRQMTETSTIIITNLPEDVTSDSLQYYFMNARKSGGGDIEEIDLQLDQEYCLITFKDTKVVASVCSRESHHVMGSSLKVMPYHMCLGKPVSPESAKPWTKPDKIVTKRQLEWKLKFVRSKESEKDNIARQLQKLCADIIWRSKPVEIECSLTKSDKCYRQLGKTWTDDVEQELTRLMDTYMERRFTANDEAFRLVRGRLGDVVLSYPDEVGVFIEKKENSVILISTQRAFRDAETKIQGKFDEVQRELAKRKEKITTTKQFDIWKVRYLSMIDFDAEITNNYPNVGLQFDMGEGTLEFTGPQMEVNDAILATYEKLQKVREKSVKLPVEAIKLLNYGDTQSQISRQLRQGHLLDLWEIHTHTVLVYVGEGEDFSRKKMIFKSFYIMLEFEIDKKSEILQRTDKWTELEQTLYRSFPGCIVLDKRGSKIKLCARKDVKTGVQHIFDKFLSANSIYREELRIGKYVLQFVRRHMESELTSRIRTLQSHQVKIEYPQTDLAVIHGTAEGLSEAKRLFDSLTGRVSWKQHKLTKPGIQQYLKSARGQESVRSIETTTPCIVHISEAATDMPPAARVQDQKHTLQLLGLTQDCAQTNLATGQRMIIYGGDMIQLKVDVLVNAGNEEMRHTGGLAAAILKAGGRSIQKECSDYVAQHGSVSVGSVVVSGAGNLVCKYIVHAVGPRWSGGDKQEPKLLESAIENCLVEADKRQCCSIAFPALCTGVYKYPVDKACDVIITTVNKYFQTQTGSALRDIYLCDINPKTVNAFMKALSAIVGIRQTSADTSGDKKVQPAKQPPKDSAKQSKQNDSVKDVTSVVFGNTQVEVVKGNISAEQVDVIINSASDDLDLGKGKASKALLIAGGSAIQDECKTKYPNGISVGEVAVTTAGNLPCKHILHICLYPFKNKKSVETLESYIENCLVEADKLGCQSIGFPALGTGAQGYPSNIVADSMFKCTYNYCNKHKDQTTLKLVKFVVFNADTKIYKTFTSSIHQYTDKAKPKTSPSDFSKLTKKVVNITKDRGEFEIGEIHVHVVQGDITDQDTVAVVTSSNTDLDLVNAGQVTKALLAKGGPEIEKDCEKKRDQMKSKGITMVTGGQLKCKHIMFIAAPNDVDQWEPVVCECLKMAEGQGVTTISIPALGTVMGHDPGKIASLMYLAICRFAAERTDPKVIQEIRLVIFQQTMVDTFINGIKSGIEGQSILSQLGNFISGIAKHLTGDSKPTSSDQEGTANITTDTSSESDNVCVLTVYAEGNGKVDGAVRRLEKIIGEEWCSQTVTDNAVWKLDQKQVDNIREVAKKNTVRIIIDQDIGEIQIQGLIHNVMSVKDTIYDEFRAFDKVTHEKKHAELLTNVVKWFWIDTNSTSKQFTDVDVLKIETAYKNKENSLMLTDENLGEDFEIDFQQLLMFYIESPKVKYPVMRRDIIAASSIETPSKWDAMGTDENLRMIKLDPACQEYKDVAAEFTSSVGRTPNIIEIHRIQNKTLYTQYAAKRKLMEACNQGIQNERVLWHGTDVNAYQSIIAHGYNRSYCGKNAVAFGEGVYFAVNADYSDRPTYAKPDPGTGHKRMFRALVLVGHYGTGQHGMRVPPIRQQGNPDILYDSVTNDMNNLVMFVIFHDTQAYPDHIITYV